MGYDKRPGGFGGGNRGGFKRGGRPQFGGRAEQKELFSATCATCQKECQVPFRPTGERPVYCHDCFRNTREDSGTDFSRPPRSFDRPKRDFPPRRDFGGASNFAPKPVAPAPDTRVGDLQKQVAALHVKVDSIIALLAAKPATAPVEAAPAEKPKAAKKAATKAKAKK